MTPEPGLPLTTGEGNAGDPEASLLCFNKEHHDLVAECARLRGQLDADIRQRSYVNQLAPTGVVAPEPVSLPAAYERDRNEAEERVSALTGALEEVKASVGTSTEAHLIARAALEAVGRADT